MQAQGRPVVGKPAPNFNCHAIIDGRIKEVALSSYTEANHWLVLIFFPKAWSFICPTEIRQFSSRYEEFLYSRTCAVVFASTDSEYCLRAWNSTSELEGGLDSVHVPLVSDSNHQLCRDYGVLIEDEGTAQRALFIIDPKGILRSMSVIDADVGRSVDEVQRILDALAFKDEFGEGCPVDWKKGDKGIDIASKSKVEGRIEVDNRKSWTEWARPKLSRAWSGASAVTASTRGHSGDGQTLPTLARLAVTDELPLRTGGHRQSFGSHLSPYVNGKHEGQIEQALALLRAEQVGNERAMTLNRELGTMI